MTESPEARAWRLFRMDVARWVEPAGVVELERVTPREVAVALLRHVSVRALAWYRFGSWCKARGIRGLPSWVQRRVTRLYGLEMVPGADVGGGLYIAHPVGCTVVAEAIGENVTIIGPVTLGYRGDPPRWPRVADGAFLGAGCRVLGGIEVGAGAQVGANAVVLRDVPPGATAVGIPAQVVVRDRAS